MSNAALRATEKGGGLDDRSQHPQPLPSIWDEPRRRLWAYSLMRRIDLVAGTDRIEIVRPRRDDPDFSDTLLDGTTLIVRPEGDERTNDQIIAAADAAWRERRALRAAS